MSSNTQITTSKELLDHRLKELEKKEIYRESLEIKIYVIALAILLPLLILNSAGFSIPVISQITAVTTKNILACLGLISIPHLLTNWITFWKFRHIS